MGVLALHIANLRGQCLLFPLKGQNARSSSFPSDSRPLLHFVYEQMVQNKSGLRAAVRLLAGLDLSGQLTQFFGCYAGLSSVTH